MMQEYVAWIGLDLAYQGIDDEIAGMPGDYAPPRGGLFVAPGHERLMGMIALRPFEGEIGEMKRLFVRPEARGRGLARQLIDHALTTARQLGYTEIRLDTLPMMTGAQALYVSLGFADIAPYYDTPVTGTRFMGRRL